jgi:hypothetical protein
MKEQREMVPRDPLTGRIAWAVGLAAYLKERLIQMTVDPESAWEDPDLKSIAA